MGFVFWTDRRISFSNLFGAELCDVVGFQAHKAYGELATLFTHPNNHLYDSGVLVTDEKNCVKPWLHQEDKRIWYQNQVNAGIHLLSNRIFNGKFELFQEFKKVDLDRDVLNSLISWSELYAYHSPEYVVDMGIQERLEAVTKGPDEESKGELG